MDGNTTARLLSINRQFYQTFARQFSATRQRLQPGVQKVLADLPLERRLLDLGCGNGELARQLQRRAFRGSYTGLDFSRELLDEARQDLPAGQYRFYEADLADPGWAPLLAGSAPFDTALAFAAFHHLPGAALRLQVLTGVRGLLAPGGRLVHSEWQFTSSPRLAARIQPWEAAGLSAEQVEPGDALLDWRGGGQGLRYVHLFSPAELAALAEASGFTIRESFLSDGENGRLGLYQVWMVAG